MHLNAQVALHFLSA